MCECATVSTSVPISQVYYGEMFLFTLAVSRSEGLDADAFKFLSTFQVSTFLKGTEDLNAKVMILTQGYHVPCHRRFDTWKLLLFCIFSDDDGTDVSAP